MNSHCLAYLAVPCPRFGNIPCFPCRDQFSASASSSKMPRSSACRKTSNLQNPSGGHRPVGVCWPIFWDIPLGFPALMSTDSIFTETRQGLHQVDTMFRFHALRYLSIHRKSGRFLFCLQDLQSDLTAALKGCHSLFHGANLIVQYPFANKIRSGIRLLQHRKRSAEIPGRYTYQRLKGSAEMA